MAERETVAENLMRLTDAEATYIRRRRLDADRCIECSGATYEPHAWWCCWSVSSAGGTTQEQRESRARSEALLTPPATNTERGLLEIETQRAMTSVARTLQEKLPHPLGFAVFCFDFGGRGNLAYVSNADRGDMLRALEEFIGKHRQPGGVRSVFDVRRKS